MNNISSYLNNKERDVHDRLNLYEVQLFNCQEEIKILKDSLLLNSNEIKEINNTLFKKLESVRKDFRLDVDNIKEKINRSSISSRNGIIGVLTTSTISTIGIILTVLLNK